MFWRKPRILAPAPDPDRAVREAWGCSQSEWRELSDAERVRRRAYVLSAPNR